MTGRTDDAAVAAVAALADGVRRSLFDFVRRTPHAVTREQAASAVGISRKLAAFHLDKLVTSGLLVTHPSREPGRVGRRPKEYAVTDSDVAISIPARKPALLAEVLLEAVVSEQPGESAAEAAKRVGGLRGRLTGHAERDARRPGRLGPERALALLRELLERLGYETAQRPSGPVTFRSCPFHPMAAQAPDVVCGIHHAYVTGLVEGLGAASVEATLAPRTDRCCVELRAAGR